MKHTHHITRITAVPPAASLLEVQQKVAVFRAIVDAFNALGGALETWLGIRDNA